MKDRLITVAGALLSIALVYALFFQGGAEAPVSTPTSLEAGPNGYLGLQRWLDQAGTDTTSWQQRFQQLNEREGSSTGNVMLTTLPHQTRVRDAEVTSLKSWVQVGNTLVVMAALDDTPSWTVTMNSDFLNDLRRLTGLRFSTMFTEDDDLISISGLRGQKDIPLVPVGEHPLMEGVSGLELVTDARTSLWEPDTYEDHPLLLRLAEHPDYGIDAIWQLREGAGHIIIIGSASLFTNRQIAAADNRQLIANIANYHLAPGGQWLFDDMHQGVSELYDPSAFYADSRVHLTLAFLIGCWFVYLVGSSGRLALPREQQNNPMQGDFVDAIGGLMARKLSNSDTGLMMFDGWFKEIAYRAGNPGVVRAPWQHLQTIPTLSAKQIKSLRRRYDRLQDRHKVNLQRLHDDLQSAREAIG